MHHYPLWRIAHQRCLAVFASLCLIVFATEAAQAGDYFVNPSGVDGAFRTVQSAVNAVAGQNETERATIFIAPGKYVEQVRVEKPFITFIGQGAVPADVIISFNKTPSSAAGTWGGTVSLPLDATAFMARNLTFENSTPASSESQALALHCEADRAIFDNVQLVGYQDTVLVWRSTRQYFRNSFITGDVDFIFGNATAVFDRCTIESTGQGYITSANTTRSTANGMIFLDCKLVKGPSRHDGTTAPNGSVFLGRPWLNAPSQQNSSVIFIRTRMGTHIRATGWDPWDSILNPALDRDPYTRFSEWGSMTLAGQLLPDSNQDGMPNGRVQWADPMTAKQAANYTLDRIFGPVEFWNAATQPETSDRPYTSQGEPWNPHEQLLSLPAKPGARPQLLNISTRFRIGGGQSVGIGGFIVTGSAPKKVIVRAMGPSLGGAGLANVLADPVLEIHGGAQDNLIARNDNWRNDPAAAELESMGMMPGHDREAATVLTLLPGQYTAVISASDGSAGTALVEMYDIDPVADAQFGNVSTLGFAGTGDDGLIGGFVVSGPGWATIVVRAIGPSLSASGVQNAIENPTLSVHDSHGNVTSNDDWQAAAEPIPVSLQPRDPRESALQLRLAPGSYTVIVRGKADTTGVALVEAYNLQ